MKWPAWMSNALSRNSSNKANITPLAGVARRTPRPCLEHVGFAFFVAGAISELRSDETARFVESSRPRISLERPQRQTIRTQLLRDSQKLVPDPSTLIRGRDI
jgi:hypothetical protein